MMGLCVYVAEEKFDDICSRFDTNPECDRQTDTGRRLVPRLHITSRGKIYAFIKLDNDVGLRHVHMAT